MNATATRDAYTQFADAAEHEDDPSFDDLMEEIRSIPVNSDDEKHLRDCLCDQLEMVFVRLKPGTKELITENIARGLDDLPSAQTPLVPKPGHEEDRHLGGAISKSPCAAAAAPLPKLELRRQVHSQAGARERGNVEHHHAEGNAA